MAEWSPYNYTFGNPISFIDHDGRAPQNSDWIPELQEDGSVNYISEDGDSYDTFVEQYGSDAAHSVFEDNCHNTCDYLKLDRGYDKKEIYNEGDMTLTSNKIYPLIINSSSGSGMIRTLSGVKSVTTTDIQDIHNQYALARSYESMMGNTTLDMSDYFVSYSGIKGPNIHATGLLETDKGYYTNAQFTYAKTHENDLIINISGQRAKHSDEPRYFHSRGNTSSSYSIRPLQIYYLGFTEKRNSNFLD